MSAPTEAAMTKPANRSIPSADVIPVLRVHDVRGAARWLVDALGFRERRRIADVDPADWGGELVT